jgi:hypothetical protein
MTDLQKVLEKLEETLLVVRQSTPESLSSILLEIRNKVDAHGKKLDQHIITHEEDIKIINDKLEVIYPEVAKDMEKAKFWSMFRELFRMGGSTVLWIVGVIAAIIILIGYGKILFITWLGLEGK